MFIKKIIIGIFILCSLCSCAQNTALLGPAYTFATTGNAYQAGFTYSGNKFIEKATGKSATENLREAITPKKKDTEFQRMVKKNIEETRKKLNLSNQ